MTPFTVRCCEIKHSSDANAGPAVLSASWRGPVVLANLFGCALSILLLVLSLVYGDGMSLLTTLLLSVVSVFVGITNRWSLRLPKRPPRTPPQGDVVIRWPNASFLVIRCTEDIARELFFSPESVDYYLDWTNGFIFLSLLGTLFLMISMVALANAKIQLPIAWAGCYIVLNIAHWVAAALPRKLNWDFSTYILQEQSIDGGPFNRTFTDALWKAILLTQSVRWVKATSAAPKTEAWEERLHEAEHVAKQSSCQVGPLQNPMWDKTAMALCGMCLETGIRKEHWRSFSHTSDSRIKQCARSEVLRRNDCLCVRLFAPQFSVKTCTANGTSSPSATDNGHPPAQLSA